MKFTIPTDWDGETWCQYAVCWPDSITWRGVLLGFLTLPARGRTWDEKSGSIKDIQVIGQEIRSKNLPLENCLMACNDEILQSIANALNALAAATTNNSSNCCCESTATGPNGGVIGSVPNGQGTGTIPVVGGQPVILEPGEYPPNYDSEEEYLVDKCRLANMIADAFIASLRALAGLSLANITVLATLIGLAVATIIILPPAGIPIMIYALLALGGFLVGLDMLADHLADRHGELVCMLYEGETATTIVSTLSDFLDEIIALLPASSPQAIAIKTVAIVLLNTDTLNQLFNGAAVLGYPDVDCSTCDTCDESWEFEESLEGWESGNTLPTCMESYLELTGSVTLTLGPDMMQAETTGGTGTSNGLFEINGLNLEMGANPSLRIVASVALSAAYVDAALVATDGTCQSQTFDNNWLVPVTQDIKLAFADLANKTLDRICFYVTGQSNNQATRLDIGLIELKCNDEELG